MNQAATTLKDRAMDFIRSHGGLARQRDLESIGVRGAILSRLVKDGALVVPVRGVYQDAEMMMFYDEALVLAQMRTGGVVCLCSAADYHGLTDRTQTGIWLAVQQDRNNTRTAAQFDGSGRRLHLVRWSDGRRSGPGIQRVDVDGITVPITSPERTVVDLLRYRGDLPHQEFAQDAFSALVAGKFDEKALLGFAADFGHLVRVQDLLKAHKAAYNAVSRM